jgi:signal transduction histidine kinase
LSLGKIRIKLILVFIKFLMTSQYLQVVNNIFGIRPETEIKTKLFLVISFLLSVGGLIAEVGNLFMELPASLLIQTFVMVLFVILLHIYVRISGKTNVFLIFLFILISVLFIMLIWPQNGGFGGPILYYFFIIPFSIAFFLNRKEAYFAFSILIGIITLFIIYYRGHPDEITPYKSVDFQIIDNLISLFLTGWISMEISIYYREQQVESQNQLQKKNELIELQIKALQDLDKHKNSIFAVLSHDINSPINNATSVINLLKDGDLTEEEKKKFVIASAENLNEISSQVGNILFWAKSQMNGIEITKVNFNVEKVINEIVLHEAHVIQSKSIVVQTSIPYDLYALGDVELFKIVFRNLLKNAIKFSFKKSIVTVVGGINSFGEVEIEVADEGIGISLINQGSIFKGTKSTQGTNNEKGNGLGLKLCKLFTETNGGRIEFISKENKGSNFIFTIPKGKNS